MKSRLIIAICSITLLACSCIMDIPIRYKNEPVALSYAFSEVIKCKEVQVQDGKAIIFLAPDEEDDSFKVFKKGDDIYNELSLKHRDSFTGKLMDGAPGPLGNCFAKDFTSIDIVCDRDFDASHPAGSSLADIVNYEVFSIYPWIRDGYVSNKMAYQITKRLSTVKPDDMTMISIVTFIILRFAERPQEIGDYMFRFTLVTDDGLTYEIDQDVTF